MKDWKSKGQLQWTETSKPAKGLRACVALGVLDCRNRTSNLGRPLRVRPAVPVLQPRREDERLSGQARASLAILALHLHLRLASWCRWVSVSWLACRSVRPSGCRSLFRFVCFSALCLSVTLSIARPVYECISLSRGPSACPSSLEFACLGARLHMYVHMYVHARTHTHMC